MDLEEDKLKFYEYFDKSEDKLETFVNLFLKAKTTCILDKSFGKHLFKKIYDIYKDDIYGDQVYQNIKTIIIKRNKSTNIQMQFLAHSFYMELYKYCGENLKFILCIIRNESLLDYDFRKLSMYFKDLDKESDDFIEFYNIYKSKYSEQFYDLMWQIFKNDPIREMMNVFEKMVEYKKKNKILEDKIKELELTVLHYENMPYSENYYKAQENFNILKN